MDAYDRDKHGPWVVDDGTTDDPADISIVRREEPQSVKGAIHWRDTFGTWPSLKIEVQLLPWHWHIDLWHDFPLSLTARLDLLAVRVELSADRTPFGIERVPVTR